MATRQRRATPVAMLVMVALCALWVIPMTLQRYFIRGLTAGSVGG
jgi:ABC-type glycerol-3-phosphate transport system permease component